MKKSHLLLACILISTVSSPTSGGELSVDKVLSLPEVSSFLSGSRVDKPHPAAPDQVNQFGRLVGIWRAQTEMRSQDGTWVAGPPAVWIWKYALGGFATQDLWIQPKEHLPPYMKALGRTYLLTSIRVFDPNTGQWRIAWAANGAGQGGGQDFGTFTATAQDGDMVLSSEPTAFGYQRVTFSNVTTNSFVWTSEYSKEGEEWVAFMRVRARRQK